MWQYNYEAACLCHSYKGTTWKKHKYIGIRNGRYIYPRKAPARTRPVGHEKNVGVGTVHVEKRLYVPYDVGTSNEYATFYKDQDRPMFDKPFKLITHDKYMHIDDTYTNSPVGYGTTSPVSSEANRKAQANKLRKKRVEDAKKAGAKVVDEASRREAARRRRRDSVIDATFAGRVQSEEQREWQRRKKLRMQYNEYLKQAKDYEKRKEDKKKRRQEAKAKAKKAWNKFKDMTFDTGNRRTEK